MSVDELFEGEFEIIDEDIRKWAAGAVAGMALAAPMQHGGVEKTNAQAMAEYNAKQEIILAKTMWGEARGHGESGMRAVGHVIVNRAQAEKPKLFGQGVVGVATKPKQFSCWNANDPNWKLMKKMDEIDLALAKRESPVEGKSFEEWVKDFKLSRSFKDYQQWRIAKKLAKEILNGANPDPTKGALFYHTTAVHPSWASKLEKIGQVANHVFYTMPQNRT